MISTKRVIACCLAVLLTFPVPVHAGVIGTEQMLAQEARSEALSRVEAFMAREQVVAQLEAWGVAPALAAERAGALSDAELQRLAATLDEQPAGAGALELVVIVGLVLVILELTGNIDIFKKF